MKKNQTKPTLYWKRDGTPYTGKNPVLDWSRDFGENAEDFEKKRRVAYTKLWNGIWISTIWLGLDSSFGMSKRPLIFETMVFSPNGSDMFCERTSSEKEAELIHQEQVEKWKSIESIWPLCKNVVVEWLNDIQYDLQRLERAFKKGSKDAKKHGNS